MSDTFVANKRIMRNTFLLYVRMIFVLLITLYTSRVILKVLGVENYGIYNVIAGFITLFSFFNYSMSSAAQRFFSFEIGQQNFLQLTKVFNCSLLIHIGIAIIIVILTETVGLWFLYNKIVIPEDRIPSAALVFHFSVVTLVIQTIQIPFNALIQARERMDIYALISLIEVLLKLIIVYLLLLNVSTNKLEVYAIFVLIVTIIIFLCNLSYCYIRFKESHFQLVNDKKVFKELSFYSGWSLFGNIAAVAQTQGINVLLNLFFGPLINSAYGIMMQVQNAANLFSNSFFSAIKPQIIQSYSSSDLDRFNLLVNKSSKYSFILVFLFVSPIIYNIDFILKIWLNDVPNNTSLFIIFSLSYLQIESLSYSLMTAVQATGKIKAYQIILGTLIFLNLPISYFLLYYGFPIYSVFILLIFISVCSLFIRFIFLKNLLNFNITYYFNTVFIKVIFLAIVNNLILYYLTNHYITYEVIDSFIKIFLFGFITIITSILIGLDKNEKIFIFKYIKYKLKYNIH